MTINKYYLFSVKKKDVDKIKNITYEKVLSMEVNNNQAKLTDFIQCKKLFSLGALDINNSAEEILSCGMPLFTSEKVMNLLSCPYEISKENLLKMISIYEEKIIDFYEDCMIDTFDEFSGRETSREKVQRYAEGRKKIWKEGKVLNLDEDSLSLTNSWLYEYMIFSLVYLLKTINWREDVLLCADIDEEEQKL